MISQVARLDNILQFYCLVMINYKNIEKLYASIGFNDMWCYSMLSISNDMVLHDFNDM
jgi:hypothetical protein